MSKLAQIVDDLSALTILEASELVKTLEEKWGVSAAAPSGGGGGPAVAEQKEEQTEFDVVLVEVDRRVELESRHDLCLADERDRPVGAPNLTGSEHGNQHRRGQRTLDGTDPV